MNIYKFIEITVRVGHLRRFRSCVLKVVFPGILIMLATATLFAQKSAPEGKPFGSPDAAVDAFVAAAEAYDLGAMMEILGPNSRDLVQTGEQAYDRDILTEFAKLARDKKSITFAKRNRNMAMLAIGPDDWPFPIPMVKRGANWYFDTAAGREEVLYRRIGNNELDAIDICRGYVDAQHQYALKKHDGALVNQYAQRVISTPGKHDGLAWQNADGTWGGTVGERAAKALEKSYTGQRAPFHGYYFQILTKQGKAAPLGEMDYVQKDAMIGGFALIAYPAIYQVTGVKTFMISHDGVVYEKDLGPQTPDIAPRIDRFDPDKTWSPVLAN